MYQKILCNEEKAEAEQVPMLEKQVEDLGEEKQKYVTLVRDDKPFQVMVHDILYYESRGRRQYLTMADGSRICIYMTMIRLDGMLRPFKEIYRVGRWYAINLDHVEMLECETVYMDNGFKLFLPRPVFLVLKEYYATYRAGD